MKVKIFFVLSWVALLLGGSIIPMTLKATALSFESDNLNETASTSVNDYNYVNYPEFSNMMPVTVTAQTNQVADGFIFFTNVGFQTSSDPGLFIVDDAGEPVYLHVGESGKYVTDFKVQTVNGKSYLVYHEGTPHIFWSYGKYYVMDDTYTIVDVWEMKNGHQSDEHEMQLLENGNALLLAYTDVPFDLKPYGGPTRGVVVENVIQELNPAKEVVWEWRSLDHIPITESYNDLGSSPVDYLHLNAIEVDNDGNLLLSSRNTSSITKIDRQTGDIIWRLGGKSNQFTFTNDYGFSFQHDIRRLENGNITLFDNGNFHGLPHSRAIEYSIDEINKTVTRVWRYPENQSVFAPYMGNTQRLSNGNTMMGWGAIPRISEVTSSGDVAFSMDMGGLTYRAFRSEWNAIPATPPKLAVVYSDPTTASVYSSWNGATHITDYEIYAGPTVNAMTLVTTTARTGFETAVTLTNLDPNLCVFKIRPIHQDSGPMQFSNVLYRLEQPNCFALLSYKSYLPLVHK